MKNLLFSRNLTIAVCMVFAMMFVFSSCSKDDTNIEAIIPSDEEITETVTIKVPEGLSEVEAEEWIEGLTEEEFAEYEVPDNNLENRYAICGSWTHINTTSVSICQGCGSKTQIVYTHHFRKKCYYTSYPYSSFFIHGTSKSYECQNHSYC